MTTQLERAELAGALTWNDGSSLLDFYDETALDESTWRYDDSDGERDELHALALRYCFDIDRLRQAGSQNDFMRDMVERAKTTYSLTPAQVRGVLNTLGGGIVTNRARFATTLKNARFRGEFPYCIVCGRKMKNPAMLARRVGWTCYRRVMGA